MEKIQVKFGDWIEAGFYLYKQNFSTLVLAAIIAIVLSTLTVGILLGPLLAGLALISLRLFDKSVPLPTVRTVFHGFDYFLNSLFFAVFWGIAVLIGSAILGIIPGIGQLLALLFVYVAQTYLMFGIYLIVDQKLNFWPASMVSYNVVKTNFWHFFGFAVVTGIIGTIGGILIGIGIVLTMPIQICITAVAYREIFSNLNFSES